MIHSSLYFAFFLSLIFHNTFKNFFNLFFIFGELIVTERITASQIVSDSQIRSQIGTHS